MTCNPECTQFDLAMELLIENDLEERAETAGQLINKAMQIERSGKEVHPD